MKRDTLSPKNEAFHPVPKAATVANGIIVENVSKCDCVWRGVVQYWYRYTKEAATCRGRRFNHTQGCEQHAQAGSRPFFHAVFLEGPPQNGGSPVGVPLTPNQKPSWPYGGGGPETSRDRSYSLHATPSIRICSLCCCELPKPAKSSASKSPAADESKPVGVFWGGVPPKVQGPFQNGMLFVNQPGLSVNPGFIIEQTRHI